MWKSYKGVSSNDVQLANWTLQINPGTNRISLLSPSFSFLRFPIVYQLIQLPGRRPSTWTSVSTLGFSTSNSWTANIPHPPKVRSPPHLNVAPFLLGRRPLCFFLVPGLAKTPSFPSLSLLFGPFLFPLPHFRGRLFLPPPPTFNLSWCPDFHFWHWPLSVRGFWSTACHLRWFCWRYH